jgi:hypothetical protein
MCTKNNSIEIENNSIGALLINLKTKMLTFSRKHRRILLQPWGKQRFLKETMKRRNKLRVS